MFDKRVVESDKFTDLPNSSKALYFMAGMSADDKGFFQPRRLQKICGFSDDDFKILIAKQFFIAFESGVMVVTDWNKNNWLDKRRITETEYIDELKLLKLINEKYELVGSEEISAKPMLSENSIVENSIEYIKEEIYKEEKKPKKFKPPTLEEVKKYCEERKNNIDAQYFLDYYTRIGWVYGKNRIPIKDWKSCIRTWERKNSKDIPEWFDKDYEPTISKEEQEELNNLLDF